MKKKVNMLLLFVFSAFLGVLSVSASTYTPTNNLFEGTYSNNLIDMAQSQIDNFTNKKFVIFQVDYNYYLVTGDDYSVAGNRITFNNSTIISAIRNSSGYSSYEYNKTNETSTTISTNYAVISNIDFPKAVASSRFEDYRSKKYGVLLLTFILGLIFAIFITKERRF